MAYVNKWVTFVAAIPVMLSYGTVYTFAVWADALKEIYGLSQTQIETIGSACNVGIFFAIIAGVVYDKLERYPRLGPRLGLLIGAVINFTGYLALWAAATRRFEAQFWQLVALAFIACSGSAWFDASCLVTNVRNFPNHRGLVVGSLKSAVGLSASFYTVIYLSLLQPLGPAAYILFLAVAPAISALLAATVTNRVPFVQQSEVLEGPHAFTTERRFHFAIQVIGTLAAYLMLVTLLGGTVIAGTPVARFGLTAGAGLLLLPLLAVPSRSGGLFARSAFPGGRDVEVVGADDLLPYARRRGGHGVKQLDPDPDSSEAPLLASHNMQEEQHDGTQTGTLEANDTGASEAHGQGRSIQQQQQKAHATPTETKACSPPNLSPLQCLASLDFWLLFSACCLGNGAGLTLNNNMAQLVRALGGPKDGSGVFVSLYGIGNCAGRLALGFLSERMLHSSGVPRPLFLIGASGSTAVVCLLVAYASLPALYPLSMATGLCFGAYWSLMPSLVSELFGLKHFATNYTLATFAPAIGGVVMASQLAGFFYQRAIQHHGALGNTCIGQDCFQLTFLILGGLGVLATACSAWLYLRTPDVYQLLFSALHRVPCMDGQHLFQEGSNAPEQLNQEGGSQPQSSRPFRSRSAP